MLPYDLLLSCTCVLTVSIPHPRSLCGYQAVTIGARDENTKALLLSKMSKDVSMTMPPEPKLSYTGPMYLGNDDWNSDGEILSSAAKTAGAVGTKAAAAGKQASLHRQQHGAMTAHNSHQSVDPAEAAQDTRLSSSFLRREVPGLARDVDTVNDIAHKTVHAFSNIGSGMAQAFDMKDSSVHPKKPVKILTHV